jgi:hypothetical protein
MELAAVLVCGYSELLITILGEKSDFNIHFGGLCWQMNMLPDSTLPPSLESLIH